MLCCATKEVTNQSRGTAPQAAPHALQALLKRVTGVCPTHHVAGERGGDHQKAVAELIEGAATHVTPDSASPCKVCHVDCPSCIHDEAVSPNEFVGFRGQVHHNHALHNVRGYSAFAGVFIRLPCACRRTPQAMTPTGCCCAPTQPSTPTTAASARPWMLSSLGAAPLRPSGSPAPGMKDPCRVPGTYRS